MNFSNLLQLLARVPRHSTPALVPVRAAHRDEPKITFSCLRAELQARRSLALLMMAVLLAGMLSAAAAPVYAWTNFVGMPGGAGNVDGPSGRARFSHEKGVVVDGAGNLIVADYQNHRLRKVSLSGEVSTLALTQSGIGEFVYFLWPNGLARDAAGNLYVSLDFGQIAVVSPQGTVSNLAGALGSGSVDGVGSAARFNGPQGLALDLAGNLFVADTSNHTIRKITPAGVVTTLAGSPGQAGALDGTGSAARFNQPSAVAVDGSGNVLVADTLNGAIRKITPAGAVTTWAGVLGEPYHVDGAPGTARFVSPARLALDPAGNLYVAENSQTVRKVTPAGNVTTLAGKVGTAGSADGPGSDARFYYPAGLALDSATNLYVADSENCTIRRITPGGAVTTVAGQPPFYGDVDGMGTAARFDRGPTDVAVDSTGNVYAVDQDAHKVRKVTPGGLVTTLAGQGTFGSGSADGVGTNAQFYAPSGIAVDGNGTVFVADYGNHTLRKISADSTVTTIAGSPGVAGTNDGPLSTARLHYPRRIAVDGVGNLYFTEWDTHIIRKVTTAGNVITLAGSNGVAGSADGLGTAARFNQPSGLAVDGLGNIYVADENNHAIRKVTPAGVVSTLAGQLGVIGGIDGIGTAARLYGPRGLAIDTVGNLYVADSWNNTIRCITPDGVVTTLGGSPEAVGGWDGVGTNALFSFPQGIAVLTNGTIYAADSGNNRIAKGSRLPLPTISRVFNAGSLVLSWPADFTGWRLEMQTNSPATGIRTNWTTVPGSALTNRVTIPVSGQSGSGFFRLAFP